VVTAALGPVTNYASASVPSWAQSPWVVWPVFGALVLAGIALVLLARRLDGGGADAAPSLTPVPPLAASRLGSLRPPPPPEHTRGRDPELNRLEEMLRRPNGRFAVLCAAGGVGKTTIATELARRAERDGYAVFWIRWRDTVSLGEQLTQVAVACGLPEEALRAAHAGRANLPDLVWEQLARTRKWLVVLDSADRTDAIGPEPERLAHYRGWIRPDGGGLLLVTSRDTGPHVWGDRAEILRLRPLDAPAGGRVLLDAAPGAGTPEEAEALANRLGGLPLALRAVAKYLTGRTGRYRTFHAYQEALERDLPSLLGAEDPNAADPEVARQLVRHTWELSLDQLESEGIPLARPLLRLLALFAEAPIPRSLITRDLVRDATGQAVTEAELDRALAGLDRYDLLGVPESPVSGDVPVLVLHPLVREITALAHSAEAPDLSAWHRAIATRLTIAVDEFRGTGRSDRSTVRLLTFHLLSPLGSGRRPGGTDGPPDGRTTSHRYG
jgi:hypothetical protein